MPVSRLVRILRIGERWRQKQPGGNGSTQSRAKKKAGTGINCAEVGMDDSDFIWFSRLSFVLKNRVEMEIQF